MSGAHVASSMEITRRSRPWLGCSAVYGWNAACGARLHNRAPQYQYIRLERRIAAIDADRLAADDGGSVR